MAIYTGVNGVVRPLDYLDITVNTVCRNSAVWMAGIDGTTRKLLANITDQIDFVEINADTVFVFDLNTEEFDYETGLDIAQKYGSITITENSITVECTTAQRNIVVSYDVNIIYKDGHHSILYYTYIDIPEEFSFALNLTGNLYFQNYQGIYENSCLGTEIFSGYIYNSKNKTVTINNASTFACNIGAGLEGNGTARSKQTFNSVTINGKSFPIKIVNNLK